MLLEMGQGDKSKTSSMLRQKNIKPMWRAFHYIREKTNLMSGIEDIKESDAKELST